MKNHIETLQKPSKSYKFSCQLDIVQLFQPTILTASFRTDDKISLKNLRPRYLFNPFLNQCVRHFHNPLVHLSIQSIKSISAIEAVVWKVWTKKRHRKAFLKASSKFKHWSGKLLQVLKNLSHQTMKIMSFWCQPFVDWSEKPKPNVPHRWVSRPLWWLLAPVFAWCSVPLTRESICVC